MLLWECVLGTHGQKSTLILRILLAHGSPAEHNLFYYFYMYVYTGERYH